MGPHSRAEQGQHSRPAHDARGIDCLTLYGGRKRADPCSRAQTLCHQPILPFSLENKTQEFLRGAGSPGSPRSAGRHVSRSGGEAGSPQALTSVSVCLQAESCSEGRVQAVSRLEKDFGACNISDGGLLQGGCSWERDAWADQVKSRNPQKEAIGCAKAWR